MSVFRQWDALHLGERKIRLRSCYPGGRGNIGVPLRDHSSQGLGNDGAHCNKLRDGGLLLVRFCTYCRGTFCVSGANDIFIKKNNSFFTSCGGEAFASAVLQ